MLRYTISALAVLALIAPAPAFASATSTVTISAFVPVICNATFQSAPSQGADGIEQLGSINEVCNDGQGYKVVVDYDAGVNTGFLVVDGQKIALDGSGVAQVSTSPVAAVTTQSLGYIPGSQQISNLHVRLEPL
jgi:hypothetical protein